MHIFLLLHLHAFLGCFLPQIHSRRARQTNTPDQMETVWRVQVAHTKMLLHRPPVVLLIRVNAEMEHLIVRIMDSRYIIVPAVHTVAMFVQVYMMGEHMVGIIHRRLGQQMQYVNLQPRGQ